MKGKKINWLGEVILPFIEGDRIKNAVRSRVGQMTQQEINKNTEKQTMLFLNKEAVESDPVLKEEVRYFKLIDKLPLTKDIFYIHEKNKRGERSGNEEYKANESS